MDRETRLPDDVDALKALVLRQREEHAAAVAARDTTIELLHEKIRVLLAQRFGASSERVADAQLGLFNEAEQKAVCAADEDVAPESIEVPAHNRRVAKRKPLDPNLPRVSVVYDLQEHDKRCPHDGTALECIGSVDSEQLDIVPATVQVLRHERRKYACLCCKQYVKTAPITPQPIPKSQASPGLLAYIATGKYVDGLPLYRQAQQLERLRLQCSRTTMARSFVSSPSLASGSRSISKRPTARPTTASPRNSRRSLDWCTSAFSLRYELWVRAWRNNPGCLKV